MSRIQPIVIYVVSSLENMLDILVTWIRVLHGKYIRSIS